MDQVLAEIEFLARSANRGDVLTLLAAGPHDRQTLAAETGASQPTLGRILRDFEDRGWVRTTDDGYVATATGQLVADGLTALSERLETELHLRDISQWLPAEDFGFDLQRLAEATITVPSETRPSAPVGRVIDLITAGSHVQIFSHAFNEQTLAAVATWVDNGGQFEGVFSAGAIDAVAHDTSLRDQLQQLHAADGASIRVVDGAVPLAVTIADNIVSLLLRDQQGRLQAAIDTDDPTVNRWAQNRHSKYWESARPLTDSDLAVGD